MTFILIIVELLLLVVTGKLIRKPNVSPLLSTSLLFFAMMWNIIPTLMTILFGDSISRTRLVSDEVYADYAILESAMLLITALFLLHPKPYFSILTNTPLARVKITLNAALLMACVGLLTTVVLNFQGPSLGATYVERNSFATVSEGTEEFNLLGIISLVQGLLLSVGYVCLFMKWPPGMKTRILYFVLLSWIALVVIPLILLGARIAVLGPLILFVLHAQSQHWSKRKMTIALGGALVLTIIVGGVSAILIGQSRTTYDVSVDELLSRASGLLQPESAVTSPWQALLDETVTKFDDISWGAALVQYVGYDVAGWKPYEGVLLALVPRQLLNGKPVPGSVDGTYRGHPGRLIAAVMGFDPDSGNVQVSPATIAIWQFGYWGLIALVLCNALHLYFVNSLLLTPSLISKSLGVSLLGIPTLLTLYASPDALLLNAQRMLLIYVVLAAIVSVTSHRRKREQNQLAQKGRAASVLGL